MATKHIVDLNPDKEHKLSFTSKPGVNASGDIGDGTQIDMHGSMEILAKCVSTAMFFDKDIRAVILEAVALYMHISNDVPALVEIANSFNGHQLEQIEDDNK